MLFEEMGFLLSEKLLYSLNEIKVKQKWRGGIWNFHLRLGMKIMKNSFDPSEFKKGIK